MMNYQVELYKNKVTSSCDSVSVIVSAETRREAIREARVITRATGEVISAKKFG